MIENMIIYKSIFQNVDQYYDSKMAEIIFLIGDYVNEIKTEFL